MACASLLLLTAACGGDDNTDESKGSPAVTSEPRTSSSPEPMESASPTASASPTEAADGTTVTVNLVKGKPEKLLEDVKLSKGDRFTLKVTSDEAHEVHIHGYDKKIEVKPGEVERVTFKADQTGSFLVEVEDTGKELFSLQVK
jgi:uncharacterized cupredoxin-like copper-binding protein